MTFKGPFQPKFFYDFILLNQKNQGSVPAEQAIISALLLHSCLLLTVTDI